MIRIHLFNVLAIKGPKGASAASDKCTLTIT